MKLAPGPVGDGVYHPATGLTDCSSSNSRLTRRMLPMTKVFNNRQRSGGIGRNSNDVSGPLLGAFQTQLADAESRAQDLQSVGGL